MSKVLQRKTKRIKHLVTMADIYLMDGAPRTAAARLREAADLADEVAEERNHLLSQVLSRSA